MKRSESRLPIRDALHVKSAELWLEMGQPVQALVELEKLRKAARKHPWAAQVFRCVASAIR